jgi:uncharacterized repeat protein (TIGR01451 family)
VNIAGATSSSYTVTSADVGSTLDVVVSATNTGGGTDANAVATASVLEAPAVSGGGGSGGGSSGGGGSGGAGAPDLQVSGFASTVTPAVGDVVMFALVVYDANSKPAQGLHLTLTLPTGIQFVSGTSDRGSGCTASSATQVVCNLDWLSGDAQRANVQVYAKVTTAGQYVVSAAATSQQGVLTPANSTASVTLTTPSASSSGAPTGLNGGGTTPKTTPDRKSPTAHAFASTGRRGRTAKLRFRIYDDRGVAKAVATVKRNGKVVATTRSGFGPVAYGSTYFLGWHVPAKAAKGTYSFCIVPTDRAGNHGRVSCASLAIR